jgi:N-acetylmuramoyl-L-alanine amidase
MKKIFQSIKNHLPKTKGLGNIIRSGLLLSIIISSTYVQFAQAFPEDFYSGNDVLFWNPDACTNGGGTGTLSGNSDAEKIWNFLIGKGLTAVQAAGVMGNIQAESGYIPTRHQGSGDLWNSNYTGNAWGLAQWDGGRRYASPDKGILGKLRKDQPNLEKYTGLEYDYAGDSAAKAKIPAADLDALMLFELNYLFDESNSRAVTASGFGKAANEWETLKLQTTIENATVFWHNNFEVSNDSPAKVLQTRGGFAKDAYNSFKDKAPPTTGTTNPGDPTPGTATPSETGAQPVVFIDPGHGGAIAQYTDPKSGFLTSESPNSPEREDAIDVANRVKGQLEKAGYKVVMSHTGPTDQVKFRDRSDAAMAAKADISVSIHTTPGEINQAWPQRVGTYREYGGKRETFSNADTATKSQAYADIFAKTRSAAEGHTVTTDPNNTQQASSFGASRGDIPTKGNISLVQLWAPTAPWVYNEIAQDKGTGISEERKAAYAKGILDGIMQSVPSKGNDGCGSGFSGGNLSQTTLAYAWPQYKGLTIVATKGWQDAVAKAQSEKRYVGGIAHAGIDCGGFVTNLLVDSGFEPNYNYGGKLSAGAGPTGTQEDWAKKNWQFLGSGSSINVADLKPGDAALLPGHTFVYVGKITGFDSVIASASLDERAPMAGRESPTGSTVNWYRKK